MEIQYRKSQLLQIGWKLLQYMLNETPKFSRQYNEVPIKANARLRFVQRSDFAIRENVE